MSKVKLPKDVAGAIQGLRRIANGSADLWRIVDECYEINPNAKTVYEWTKGQGTPDLLMEALINGFEIEDTPEEKLRKYYRESGARRTHARWARDSSLFTYEAGRQEGVKQTLHILGIKIEGINA